MLSGGRLALGIPSGDRPEEYPALNLPFDYIQRMWEDAPAFENTYGSPHGGMDLLPKPTTGKLPLLITGGSQQDPHLRSLEEIGVNHAALNLRFNQAGTEETLKRLAEDILPGFSGAGITE